MSLKSILSSIAPVLGTLIGGPAGGVIAGSVAAILGLTPDSTEDQIASAIKTASPETILKIKKIEADYETKMAELIIDREKVHSEDRDSARKREMIVKDKIPAVLAILVTLGFMGVLFLFFYGHVNKDAETVLSIMVGFLGAGWMAVMNYYFGKSDMSDMPGNVISKFKKPSNGLAT